MPTATAKKPAKKPVKPATPVKVKKPAKLAPAPTRVLKDAKQPLTFHIKKRHIEIAECGDENKCVVAQGLQETVGEFFEGVDVGSTVVKISTDTTVYRYSTPNKIKREIPAFDRSEKVYGFKKWSLPPGEYTLLPPSKTAKLGARPNRFDRVSLTKGKPGRAVFKSAFSAPTRRVMRCETLCSVIR